MSLFYRIVSLWCVLGVLTKSLVVSGHSASTRMFECSCWDAHTHAPTRAPRIKRRIVFPSPRKKPQKKRSWDSDSSD